MCFIWATGGVSRTPLEETSTTPCRFCQAEANNITAMEETRKTYIYGCCPTKPVVKKVYFCKACNKEWYQGEIQTVVYTQEQQPSGATVTVKGSSVAN